MALENELQGRLNGRFPPRVWLVVGRFRLISKSRSFIPVTWGWRCGRDLQGTFNFGMECYGFLHIEYPAHLIGAVQAQPRIPGLRRTVASVSLWVTLSVYGHQRLRTTRLVT